MDRALYNQEVEKHCRITTEAFVREQIKAQLASADGRCLVPVSCDCLAKKPTVLSNVSCQAPCGDKTCTVENCPGLAKTDGSIDFDGCDCTRTTACGLTLPPQDEPPICTDRPGSGDPPTNDFGIVGRFLAAQSTATIEPTASSVKATASFDDHLGITRSDTKASHLSGEFYTYGTPHPDGSADLIIDFGLTGTDMTFVFENVDLIKDVEVPITKLSINGGTDRTTVHFAPNGEGVIPAGVLALSVELFVGTQKVIATSTNDVPLPIKVNLATRQLEIPALVASVAGVRGDVVVRGTFTNRPPLVDAGPDQTVECASLADTRVRLNGTVTDPDGIHNVNQIAWLAGPDFNHAAFSAELAAEVSLGFTPPASSKTFRLFAQDASFQAALSRTRATVRDTKAPELALSTTADCLWAPNHKMVLFELGSDLVATSTDACDAEPTIAITKVVTSQPATGAGSGQTAADVQFGARAFCVRSERQGTSSEPRVYTISVRATDASGNASTREVAVKVGHDQGSLRCAKVNPSRIVEDGDPRCTAN